MKIIHTADWHLGQYFRGEHSREQEHNAFLQWLLQLLQTEQPDALLIAGDVFDSANPPQFAFGQYYQFLAKAQAICPNIIVTGGNHDSRFVLDAPRDLLQFMNIYIIGGGIHIDDQTAFEKQIIALKNKSGQIIGAVAAIPFLREGEVRQSVAAAESYTDKVLWLREGIKAYYTRCLDYLQPYLNKQLPIIAMGHLYAAGSQLSDDEAEGRSERRIYASMGNQTAVDSDIFPQAFQYVALGHIHKSQIVGKQNHIRYSGSPIALSFGELNDKKQILVVSFEQNKLNKIEPIEIPTYRQLLRISGNMEQVSTKIAALNIGTEQATCWLEVNVTDTTTNYAVEQQIKELLDQKNINLLKLLVITNQNKPDNDNLHLKIRQQSIEIEDIINDPHTIFKQRCSHLAPEESNALLQTFEELMADI